MSTSTSNATKYRVAIRFIAVDEGWEFEQLSTATDRFTRKGVIVDVHHGPTNLITSAEKVEGEHVTSAGTQGKMFTVQSWLTGVADPIGVNGKGKRFIRLTPEQVRRFESGQGLAKIEVKELGLPAPKPAPKPEAKPAPKPGPKPAARKAPAKEVAKAS